MPLLTRLAYKPVGIALGVVGGRMAGKAYTQVWSAIARQEHAPAVMDKDGLAHPGCGHPLRRRRRWRSPAPSGRRLGWGEVISAAVVKAAVFASVIANAYFRAPSRQHFGVSDLLRVEFVGQAKRGDEAEQAELHDDDQRDRRRDPAGYSLRGVNILEAERLDQLPVFVVKLVDDPNALG
jgi:hypothetical protein